MKFKTLAVTGLAAAAMAAMPALAAGNGDEVLGMLKAIRGRASDIEAQSASLERMGTAASRESYVEVLDNIKADVNSAGKTFARIEEMKESATPEERSVLDRAEPLLKEVAENTNLASAFVNAHGERLWVPENQARIEKIETASDRLYGELGHLFAYTKVSAREKRLEKAVEAGM